MLLDKTDSETEARVINLCTEDSLRSTKTSLKHEQLTHRNTHANSIIRTARTAASELEYAVAECHLVDHYQPGTLQGIEFASNGDQFSNYSTLRVIVVFFQLNMII